MKTLNNRWISLIILLTAPLLSVIDVFIINVAIPAIKKGVQATDAEVQLVIAGYLLGYAAFLITGGRAGDAFGRKKVFLLGMLFFTIISCLCGLAQTALQLNISRFFQGISAAFMVPQTISYIMVLFPEPSERTRAVGLFGITLGLASIIGQFMGGYFSEMNGWVAGWRLIFFINLPIGAVALYMAKKFLTETKVNHKLKFDYQGVVILTIALICLIYPLIMGREAGWPLWSYISILLSLAIFWYFIANQSRKLNKGENPLIHTTLFSYKDFNLGLVAVLFFFMVHTSYLLICTVYLQDGLGIHPYEAGLAFVFFGGGFTLSSILSVRYVIRYGKVVLQWGILVMLIAFAVEFMYFTTTVSWGFIAAVLSVHGFGSGMVLPSLLNLALRNVPAHHAGAASGVYSTFQQAASALGISIIGGIFYFFTHHGSFYHAFRYAVIAQIACLLVVAIILYLLPEKEKTRAKNFAVLID